MKPYISLVVDEFDKFEAERVEDDDDGEAQHGTVRLREFSIQGPAEALRRLAAAAMDAADLTDAK